MINFLIFNIIWIINYVAPLHYVTDSPCIETTFLFDFFTLNSFLDWNNLFILYPIFIFFIFSFFYFLFFIFYQNSFFNKQTKSDIFKNEIQFYSRKLLYNLSFSELKFNLFKISTFKNLGLQYTFLNTLVIIICRVLNFFLIFNIFITIYILLNYELTNNLIFNQFFVTNFTYCIILILYIILYIILSVSFATLLRESNFNFELPFFLIFIVIILNCITITNNFLLLFFLFEIFSYGLYILIPLQNTFKKNLESMQVKINLNTKATEAGMKYFLFGAINSLAFIMFLLILLFFNIDFDYLNFFVAFKQFTTFGDNIQFLILKIALYCLLVFFFFKLSLFPFHWWIMDVFQGSSLFAVVLIAIPSKIVVIYIVFVLFTYVFNLNSFAFVIIISLVSIINMFIGSLGMLHQLNIKRFFAYSTLNHMGYIGISLLINNYSICLIYVTTYIIMMLIFFIILLSNETELIYINELKKLKSSKIVLSVFTINLFSLIGIPPLAGFWGKYYILAGIIPLIELYENKIWVLILISIILTTIISAGAYLILLRIIFFDSKLLESPLPKRTTNEKKSLAAFTFNFAFQFHSQRHVKEYFFLRMLDKIYPENTTSIEAWSMSPNYSYFMGDEDRDLVLLIELHEPAFRYFWQDLLDLYHRSDTVFRENLVFLSMCSTFEPTRLAKSIEDFKKENYYEKAFKKFQFPLTRVGVNHYVRHHPIQNDSHAWLYLFVVYLLNPCAKIHFTFLKKYWWNSNPNKFSFFSLIILIFLGLFLVFFWILLFNY